MARAFRSGRLVLKPGVSWARRVVAIAALAVACAAGFFAWRHYFPADPELRARARLGRLSPAPDEVNVVLISIDTLRADRLGCYGFRNVETPRIDALARDGFLFEQTTATVPLTLPSHSSILTGLLPQHHGVRDNGTFFLDAGRTTLAERFKAAGYATGGFVGAWVLESRFGVAQGFDRFSDRFDTDDFSRRGDAVVNDATTWIDSVGSSRFFAWVHLFDPHQPYEAPEPFASRYAAEPYLGEVAYTDQQIGRLIDHLGEKNLLGRTVITVTADHGESLGDHGEFGHGFFIYDSTISVPLIFRTPWGLTGRSRTQASSVDVLPTLLDLAGLTPEAGVDGRSLARTFFDPTVDLGRTAYSETYYPRYHFGWQHLQAVRTATTKFIEAPSPELYDLTNDPAERDNVYKNSSKAADDMRQALGRLADAVPTDERQPLDEQTRERLAALGYANASVRVDPTAVLPDPKDKIALFSELETAKGLAAQGRLKEAIARARSVLDMDSSIMDAHLVLGGWLESVGRPGEAVATLKRAMALRPDDEATLVRLIRTCLEAKQPREAVAALEAFGLALETNPKNPNGWYQLGTAYLQFGQAPKAEKALLRAVATSPKMGLAHNALGALALSRGDLVEAERRVREALVSDGDVPTAHYNLGRILEAQRQPDAAADAYRAESAANPSHGQAHFNLALILMRKGDHTGYVAELRRGVEQAPASGPCHFLLAREELKAGRLPEAETLALQGLKVDQRSELAPLGYYVLADVYSNRGDRAKAAAAAAQARRIEATSRSTRRSPASPGRP